MARLCKSRAENLSLETPGSKKFPKRACMAGSYLTFHKTAWEMQVLSIRTCGSNTWMNRY